MWISKQEVIDTVACAHHGDGEHDACDETVDIAKRASTKVIAYLVDNPGDEQPPADGSAYETGETEDVEPPGLRVGRKEEIGAGKEGNIEEDDERIAHRDAKAREEILEDARSLHARRHSVGRGVFVAERRGRVRLPEIEGIEGDEERAGKLQRGLILFEPIDHQTEEEDRDDGIDEVRERGAEAGEQSGETAFVERTLYDENSRRSHRGRHEDSNHEAPDNGEYRRLEH